MKREANKKRANRMFSLLLALTLCAAPVSGGTAVYAAADGSETISGATAPGTAGGTGTEEENLQETAGQEPAGELPEGTLPAGDSTAETAEVPDTIPAEEPAAVPAEEPAAVPAEELAETASLQADLLAAETTDWINYADSTWTVDQPIMDAADLAQMAVLGQSQDFAGKTITLGADIDLSGHLWTPIGNDTYKFSGIFDGGNHQITGLDTGNRLASAGLFGTMVGSATVRNLRVTVERIHVMGSVQRTGAGGLVGRIYPGSGGTIYNCQVTVNGTIYGSGDDGKGTVNIWSGVGGLVGVDESTTVINNCFVNIKPGAVIETVGTTKCNVHAGGFIGIVVAADTIQNSKCVMAGTIRSTGLQVNIAAAAGGFMGWVDYGSIYNCYAITTATARFEVSATNTNPCAAAPFIAVQNIGSSNIANSYAIDLGTTYDLGATNPQQGAILGMGVPGKAVISNCYYYTGSGAPAYNGKVASSNAVAIGTLEEMKKESTYATFDFVDTWTIVPELNDGYPVLQMELTDQQKMDIVTALVAAEKTFIVASEEETVKLQAVQGYVDGLVVGSLFTRAGGTAAAVKSGSAYQITFRLGNIAVQKTVTAQFVQSAQTKDQMMAEAVSAIPQAAEIVVSSTATQLQKKTAVESYIRDLLDSLDFTKANGTFAVALTSGTTYSVVLSLAETDGKTVSVTVTFINGVSESDVTLVTEGGLLTMFNGTTGYGKNNVLFEVKAELETGKKLVYQENGTQRPIYWSPILQSYVGFTTQGELSKAEIAKNIQSVAGTPENIRYGIIGTGRDNRVKIGFTDLYYFDKTVLIDDAIPEGDAERALAMDVNGDFNLSVSDLMSIIQKYVFGTEFSRATK